MFILLSCLFAGAVASGLDDVVTGGHKPGDTYNVDQQFDSFLPQVIQQIRAGGFDQNVSLPDFFQDIAPIFIGVTLKGLDDLSRFGPAQVKQLDTKAELTANLRLNRPHFNVMLAPMMHDSFTWDITHVDFTATAEVETGTGSCSSKITNFHVLSLGKITQRSPNPKFDGVPPIQFLVDMIIPHYNRWLNDERVLGPINQQFNLCQVK